MGNWRLGVGRFGRWELHGEVEGERRFGTNQPEWIPDHQKRNVDLVGVREDGVARGFDHLAVGHDHGAAIECFLLCIIVIEIHINCA